LLLLITQNMEMGHMLVHCARLDRDHCGAEDHVVCISSPCMLVQRNHVHADYVMGNGALVLVGGELVLLGDELVLLGDELVLSGGGLVLSGGELVHVDDELVLVGGELVLGCGGYVQKIFQSESHNDL